MIISTDNHECIKGNHADKDRLLIDMIWYVDVEQEIYMYIDDYGALTVMYYVSVCKQVIYFYVFCRYML